MTDKKRKIIVGLSGGVDSSAAAALLQEDGHEVVGAFMKNWSDGTDPVTGECAWRKERDDAMAAAAHLGIPFVTFDFEEAYRERVVGYMLREYEAGRTPNPDVLCNREVKFDLFLKEAMRLGADAIATGHYARIVSDADTDRLVYRLLAGADRDKDQSYFLHSLGQEQLARTLFPIGQLTKRDVRAYARAKGLPNAAKKDSQGICFVGKVDLREFLARAAAPKPGLIVTVEGATVGRHDGVQAFTIGQRHGLGLGGGEPYFVAAKDAATATLTVARGAAHPALFKSSLMAGEWHWVSGRQPEFPFRCRARIRYRQPLQGAEVREQGTGKLEVRFDAPQRAVAPGQFVVLYDGDEVLGGGVIES